MYWIKQQLDKGLPTGKLDKEVQEDIETVRFLSGGFTKADTDAHALDAAMRGALDGEFAALLPAPKKQDTPTDKGKAEQKHKPKPKQEEPKAKPKETPAKTELSTTQTGKYSFKITRETNERKGEDFWLAVPVLDDRIERGEWKALQQFIHEKGGGRYYKPKQGFPFYQDEKPDLQEGTQAAEENKAAEPQAAENAQDEKLHPIIYGRETEINLPNGEKHRATYAIMELGNITASHNEQTFAPNTDFPTENDRSYHTDRNAQAIVEQVAQKLDPSLVLTTSSTPEGTPIITHDGFVVSGNNRTMSLKLAATKYPERYQAYVDYLLNECWVFKNQCERIPEYGIKQPVLVRIDYDFGAYTTENMAKYNKATMKAESPTDRAVKLSRIVRENTKLFFQVAATVGKYETFTELYGKAAEQKNLVELLVEFGVWTQSELPQYYDGSALTAQGKEFIETILSAMVLEKEALQATSLAGVKKLRQMLITALPVLVANANLPEGSLNAALNEAILLQFKMTRSGLSFADVLRQAEMFSSDTSKWTKKACYLNRLLQQGKIRFKKAIEAYNTGVKNEQDSSLFGDTKTPEDIFRAVIVSQVSTPDRNVIENSPLVICCKRTAQAEQPKTQQEQPEHPKTPRLKLTQQQRKKVKKVTPKDPAPHTRPDTLKAANVTLKVFLGQVKEVATVFKEYAKRYKATVSELAKLDREKEKEEIGAIETLYSEKKKEAKEKLDTATAKVKAQESVYENAKKGEKSEPLKELRKLRAQLERASDRYNNVEKQKNQRIARLMKRNAKREAITSVKQAEALPDHRANKAVLSLANAAMKRGTADFSEFRDARNYYAKLFRELPMQHVRALENIKGAQAKFLSYINGLGELLGKPQEHAAFYENAFEAQIENFAAIGLVLEQPQLAKFIKAGENISLEKLQKSAEKLIEERNAERTKRAAQRLNAYEQIQKLA